MFTIIRNNITISKDDNALFNASVCGECLKDGDQVIFESPEQRTVITDFVDGKALIQINSNSNPIEGKYVVRAIMKDGRNCLIAEGKYIRKGGI